MSPNVPKFRSKMIGMAEMSPHVNDVSRCWPDKASIRTNAKGISIIRPLALTDSMTELMEVPPACEPPPPKIANKMTAGTAATTEYLKRLLTTPGTSASWVVADTIVVSDTGARLSPNTAPAKMAANINVGSAPTATPAGYISVQNATVVPYPVPTAVENVAANRNVKATNMPPSTPVTDPIHTNPSTRPPTCRTCANMPA